MDKLAAMHSAAACAIQNKITCPHNIVTCGLPTQNRIQQNFGVGEALVGQPTGVDDPCRTLVMGAVQVLRHALHSCIPKHGYIYLS